MLRQVTQVKRIKKYAILPRCQSMEVVAECKEAVSLATYAASMRHLNPGEMGEGEAVREEGVGISGGAPEISTIARRGVEENVVGPRHPRHPDLSDPVGDQWARCLPLLTL